MFIHILRMKKINEEMKSLQEVVLQKLLWGTDMCIPAHFYPHKEMFNYYKEKLKAFSSICTTEQFELLTYLNAKQLFKIH